MRSDDPTHVIESTTDHQAETGPSRSRRDFLRRGAASGVFGLTGMTAITEAAKACYIPDAEYRLSAGEQRTFNANEFGVLTLEGYADKSDYRLNSPFGLSEWCGVEPGDDLRVTTAYGEVSDRRRGSGDDECGFADRYKYLSEIRCEVTSGIIDITNNRI